MPVRPRGGQSGAPPLLASASAQDLRRMAARVPAAAAELRRRALLRQALGSALHGGASNGRH
jgi:hypothetical protein